MKEISLLIHEDAVLSTVSGPLDMFIHTNRYLESIGKPYAFSISLVREKAGNDMVRVSAPFISYKTIAEVKNTELVIIPAFYGNPDLIFNKHRVLIEWIKEMKQQGAELASLCSGCYFLAESGVLAEKPCTCHWRDMPDIKKRYPDLVFLSDKVITDNEGVYTSGGAFSSLNLILYLIEKFCGREMGIWASKMFSLDIDRVSQSHFAVFLGQRQHEDEEILHAQTYIEQNYQSPLSVEQVAEHANMSKRNFIRRFKNATKNTPLEYLQRVKVESAKKALEKGSQNISTLVYDTGYNDLKTFRQVFKKFTGLTPQEYRRKYCRAFSLPD